MCKSESEYFADKYLKRCMRYSQEVDHLKAIIDHQLKGHDEMRKELSEAREINEKLKKDYVELKDSFFHAISLTPDGFHKVYCENWLNKYEEAIKKEFKNDI